MSSANENEGKDLGASAFAGAALMVATRFAVRLLGLVSVTVLARLLTPEDFGLFGTAALILSFFILLKEVGFSEAVIKEEELTRQDLDTLWTMRLILSTFTGLALFIAAPFIASFLKDARVEPVLQAMAILPVIDAFASPASSLLLRELKYGTDFLLKSSNKIVRVVAVIVVALMLKSYWALVFGAILSSIFGVIITHIVRPFRPRLSLVDLNKHVGFAAWTYLRSISSYIANSSDEFVVRSYASTAFFGIYHMARDLARVLISDLISPVREAMLPALSRMQSDPERLATASANIFGASVIVGSAVACGIMVTAEELVLVLLGHQWDAAAPFLGLLAIGCACNSVGEVNQSTFVTADRQKSAALFWTARAVLLSVGCIVSGIFFGTMALALTFSVLSVFLLAWETHHIFGILKAKTSILALVHRPLIAGALMMATVTYLPVPDTLPVMMLLLTKVGVGVLVYCGVLLGLWKIAGFKEGPEYTLYTNLPGKLQRLVPIKLD